MTLSEITNEVARRLSVKRFTHSLAVAAQAVRLAGIHGIDPVKAYSAAVLHDIAREFSEEEWFRRADLLKISDRYRHPAVLLHSFIGAEIARTDFFIRDLDVLEAIRYHTLGFPGMDKTAQILFIADYISRDRHFIDNEFREIIGHLSLDKATEAVIKKTSRYFSETGRSLHEDTEKLREFLRSKKQ